MACYTVEFGREFTFIDHNDVFITKNAGQVGAESFPATSNTGSPATFMNYDPPAWVVPAVAGDVIELFIGLDNNYKYKYDAALKGWTGTENCTTNPDGTITVEYKDDVSWTDQTGIGFLNVTTGETATGAFTVAETSPSKIVTYSGIVWLTSPVAGDVVQLVITEPNTYRDVSYMDAQILKLTNCLNGINTHAGFLPYGSADSSVIFRSSLTSLASFQSPEIGAFTSATEIGSSGTFDSTLGYLAGVDGTLRLNGLIGNADATGQITCQVTVGFLTQIINDLTAGIISDGDDLGAPAHTLSLIPGTGSTVSLLLRGITDGAGLGGVQTNLYATTPKAFIQSGGKGLLTDYITFGLGWDALNVYLVIGDTIQSSSVANKAGFADILKNLYIGSNRGVSDFMVNHYVRNIQVSTLAPLADNAALTQSIAVLSDSLFVTDSNAGTFNDNLASWELRRSLEKAGYGYSDRNGNTPADSMLVDVNGGFTIQNTGSSDLSSRVATILAATPSIVLLRGGTNDVVSSVIIDEAWETSLQSLCTSLLAGSATKLVVGTVMSVIGKNSDNTPENRAKIAQANIYIKALPAFNENIVVSDVYTALGGETPAPTTFKGQISGYVDEGNDLHLSNVGHVLMGREYSKTIVKLIGG